MQQTRLHQKNQTKQLVYDYVAWRLANAGHSHANISNRVDLMGHSRAKMCTTMRQMACEFEKRYRADYLPLGEHFCLTPDNIDQIFPLILGQLFQVKPFHEINETANQAYFECNWCRIVALFSFAGCLSIRCSNQEMSASVHKIADWLVKFLNDNQRVHDWIEKNRGWDGFIEFFNEEKISIIKKTNNNNQKNTVEASSNEKQQTIKNSQCSKTGVFWHERIHFEFSSLEHFNLSIKDLFCKFSQLMALTMSSLGVLTLALMYVRKL